MSTGAGSLPTIFCGIQPLQTIILLLFKSLIIMFLMAVHTTLHMQKNPFLLYTRQTKIYARTAIYVNKQISQMRWYVAYDSRDVQSLALNIQPAWKLFVHNLYNEPDNRLCPGLQVLQQVLLQLRERHPNSEHLIVGDFNLHSPRWEGNNSAARRRKSTQERLTFLYDIIEQLLLRLLLPVGTITRDDLSHTPSTLDLVFGTPGIESQTIKCGTHPMEGMGLNKGSDHFSVKTVLDIR